MVYYTDSPKINRRMVAGYYLFLCLVGFAILLGPTGAGIPITLIGTDGRDHEIAALDKGERIPGILVPARCVFDLPPYKDAQLSHRLADDFTLGCEIRATAYE